MHETLSITNAPAWPIQGFHEAHFVPPAAATPFQPHASCNKRPGFGGIGNALRQGVKKCSSKVAVKHSRAPSCVRIFSSVLKGMSLSLSPSAWIPRNQTFGANGAPRSCSSSFLGA
ncbi:hypothetical protein TRVL_09883 [Trypanosoma vivax]|nr:hypothetical protein TRVL_09883 [Trypanosoma vivax]